MNKNWIIEQQEADIKRLLAKLEKERDEIAKVRDSAMDEGGRLASALIERCTDLYVARKERDEARKWARKLYREVEQLKELLDFNANLNAKIIVDMGRVSTENDNLRTEIERLRERLKYLRDSKRGYFVPGDIPEGEGSYTYQIGDWADRILKGGE